MVGKPKRKHPGGRPRKFPEPSQPVTVTLPHRTLGLLGRLDPDRARAIVKAVDRVLGEGSREQPNRQVELIEIGPGTRILVVAANRTLRRLPWLRMIEVAPTRYLLAIEPATPIEKVELALMDLIELARKSDSDELGLLEMLRKTIRTLRRGERVSRAEILVVSEEDSAHQGTGKTS